LDHPRSDRRKDHDAAGAASDHDPAGGLEHVEAPLEIERHNPVELVAGIVENRLPHVDAWRADDDVEAAGFGNGGFEAHAHSRCIADVKPLCACAAADAR